MSQQPTDEQKSSSIDWPSVLAGAGAAVTVAVILSTLGAAGTLIGAALGSMVATVSTALYKQGIQSSRRRMAEVQASALQRVGMARDEVRRAAAHSDSDTVATDLARADAHLDQASSGLEAGEDADAVEGAESADSAESAEADVPADVPTEGEAATGARGRWAGLPWRRIAVLAVSIFLVSMLAISLFEVIAGRSIGSLTGGSHDKRTSITGLFGDKASSGDHERTPERNPASTPPTQSTSTGSSPAPTDTSSPTVTSSPTGTSEPTPSEQPSDSATPSDSASPTATTSDQAAPDTAQP